MENQNENTDQKQPLSTFRRLPLLPIAFLYILGYFTTQRSEYDTTTFLGITMLVFGWICLLLSLALSVSVLFRLFVKQSKTK